MQKFQLTQNQLENITQAEPGDQIFFYGLLTLPPNDGVIVKVVGTVTFDRIIHKEEETK